MTYNAGGLPVRWHAGQGLRSVEQRQSFGHHHRRAGSRPCGATITARLAVLQVDGSLQPGNSGGPIVEEKTGKLIGVAVAKVRGRRHDRVRRSGRASAPGARRPGRRPRSDAFEGHATGTGRSPDQGPDRRPQGQGPGCASSMSHRLVAGTITPNSDGTWPPLPNTKAVELQQRPQDGGGLRTRPGRLERPGRRRAQGPDPDGAPGSPAASSSTPSPRNTSCRKSQATFVPPGQTPDDR